MNLDAAISAAPGLDAAYVYLARPTALDGDGAEPDRGRGARHRRDRGQHQLGPVRAADLAGAGGRHRACAPARGGRRASRCSSPRATPGRWTASGVPPRSVDDPSAQPFATGVGGSELHLAAPAPSARWCGTTGCSPAAAACRASGRCRTGRRPVARRAGHAASPAARGDGALPAGARPGAERRHRRARIRHVLLDHSDCGNRGWTTIGGTSVAAPLMAGIAASVNEYSRAHGGGRLGFANPFLYRMAVEHPGHLPRHHPGWQRPSRVAAAASRQAPGTTWRAGWDRCGAHALRRPAGRVQRRRRRCRSDRAHGDRVRRPTAGSGTGSAVTFTGVLTAGGDPVAGARVYLQGEDRRGVREWSTLTGPTAAGRSR